MTIENKQKQLISAFTSLATIFQDIRFSFRMLKKSPGFTLIAMLTLAIGIGSNTAIFSAVNALLLRPWPFDGAERLVRLQEKKEAFGIMSVAYPNYLDWKNQNQSFEEIACFRATSRNETGGERPERIFVRQATANLFPMLGVHPIMGRSFDSSDDRGDAEKTVVLSYGYWQRRFNGKENVIGEKILFDGITHTVIGVMPKDFHFPFFLASQCEAWTPIGLMETDEGFMKRSNHPAIDAIGKLKRGISINKAQADIDVIAAQIRKDYPDICSGNNVVLTNYRESSIRRIKPGILVLMCAVGFVLLIVSANIGNLLLVRSTARIQEFAVRSALGASRMRLIRQVLCEGVILVVLGGLAGLLVAMWGLDLIARFVPSESSSDPREFFRMDGIVLLFSFIITIGSGLLFSLVPAFLACRINLNDAMKDISRSSTGGLKWKRVREVLIVSEIMLALILLVGAGLMTHSFYQYLQANPGYNPQNVLLIDLSLSEQHYPKDSQVKTFYRDMLQRINALPGVQYASVSTNILGNWQSDYYVEGTPIPKPGEGPQAEYNCVSPEHFEAMGIHLIEGRYFISQDVQDSKPVVIIDERFAQKMWPNQNAIGKRLQAHTAKPDKDAPWREVIGVVGNIQHYGVDQTSRESLYFPIEQYSDRDVTVVVRTQGDPMQLVTPIRGEINTLDKELPAANIRTLWKVVEERSFMRRFMTILLSIFALTAFSLAMMGIYGVMAYSVTQRINEIGIRMAMGAQVSNILWMFLRNGLRLTGIGVAAGFLGSLVLSRFLSSQLYGVSAFDPISYGGVSLLLICVSLLACYFPARKAAKVDPIIALRWE